MIIVICDDVKDDRELLISYCKRYEIEQHISLDLLIYKNAGELLQDKKARNANIMLLDIYMDGASGMDAAHILRNKGFTGAIIFTTISQEHYAEGYDVEAIHYLVKPITWDKFLESLHRVKKAGMLSTKSLHIQMGRMSLDIPFDKIYVIEVLGRKTILHTIHDEITLRESLSTLEKRLEGGPFLRCYRYYIINMDHVLRLTENGFLMRNQQVIPISRDGRNEIRKQYLSYIFKQAEVE